MMLFWLFVFHGFGTFLRGWELQRKLMVFGDLSEADGLPAGFVLDRVDLI
jgi:hypothetical protein